MHQISLRAPTHSASLKNERTLPLQGFSILNSSYLWAKMFFAAKWVAHACAVCCSWGNNLLAFAFCLSGCRLLWFWRVQTSLFWSQPLGPMSKLEHHELLWTHCGDSKYHPHIPIDKEAASKWFSKTHTLTDFPSLGNWAWPNGGGRTPGEKETKMFGSGGKLHIVLKRVKQVGALEVSFWYCGAIYK